MRRLERVTAAVTDVAVAALEAPPGVDPVPAVLAAVVRAMDADACVLETHDQRIGLSTVRGVAPAELWPFMPVRQIPTAELVRRNPSEPYLLLDSTRQPFAVTDVVSRAAWLGSEFGILLRPGFGRCLPFGIPVARTSRSVASWSASRDGRDDTSADRDVAAAIQPVLDVVARHAAEAAPLGCRMAAPGLTQREEVVLRLLAEGHHAHAIARRLGISQRTVGKHLERVYRKLGVKDRLLAVKVASELGILSDGRAASPTGVHHPTRVIAHRGPDVWLRRASAVRTGQSSASASAT